MTAAAHWLAWLAPALGTAMIIATVSVHPVAHPTLGLGGTNSPLFAALNSAAAQSSQNSLPVTGFAWTNATPGPSTNASSGGLN